MLKNTIRITIALACAVALTSAAGAVPQWPAGSGPNAAKTARLAFSPLPPRLRAGLDVLRIRDMRQAGGTGGCWTHCYNMFDECMVSSEKNVCVTRVKTCMETCDRLSGLANPTQR